MVVCVCVWICWHLGSHTILIFVISFLLSVRNHILQEQRLTSSDTVDDGIDAYSKLHREADTATRIASYKQLVNAYYDLATVFYEWGWGSSFHFSYQYPFESFRESIRRHEYMLAAQLAGCSGPKKHILDVGCGIAGPARNISRFLQCQVTGITLNPYQVQRGNELNDADPFSNVTSIQGDFMHLPAEFSNNDATLFDGAYAIEATCHAPNRTACYFEIYKTLKPGAVFACYEWCMTNQFDPSNPKHLQLKKDIEEGNGLPDICNMNDCLQSLQDAGFEMIYEADLASSSDIRGYENIQTWMTPLLPSWNLFSQRFQFNWLGAIITNAAIYSMELFRIAPAGTVKTQKVLQTGGFALRDAGTAEIFTTMYLLVGRKPLGHISV
jgi:sterol 24-C-methyltransferase